MKILQFLMSRIRKGTLLDTTVLVVLSLIIIIIMAFGAVVSKMLFDVAVKQMENRAVQAVHSLSYFAFTYDDAPDQKCENYRQDIKAQRIVILKDKVIVYPAGTAATAQINILLAKSSKTGTIFTLHDRISGLPAITAVGPLYDAKGKIDGAAAVSYPLIWVESIINKYFSNMVLAIFISVTFGLIASIYIARRIKKSIFWLEPYEIAVMYEERSAIIDSIRESVIATDRDGIITLANKQAVSMLDADPQGKKLGNIIPELKYYELQTKDDSISDMEIVVNSKELVVNVRPLFMGAENIGAVATFRNKEEIEQIARELTNVQEYSQMLRAQTHEFTNRMHVIAGMVQIKAYDDLIEYIEELSQEQRFLLNDLKSVVTDSMLISLLLGKYVTASERKINFSIDSESSLHDLPQTVSRSHLMTILGNLTDNAFDAVLENKEEKNVSLFMSDYGKDLIFEIEDSGHGIPENIREKIFKRGFSTKSSTGRGMGMYLVKNAVTFLHGSITIKDGSGGGTLITVIIPKNQRG